MQLQEFLERSFERHPDKTALVCGGERLSYDDVERRSNRLAHALVDMGVRPGDRVAIFLENSTEAVLSIFAVLKAGAVFTMVNPTTKADKLSYMLRDSEARALIFHAARAEEVRESIAGLTDPVSLMTVVARGKETKVSGLDARSFADVLEEPAGLEARPTGRGIDVDLAALVYTSGSTGNPKGVMLTHLNMVSAATSITTYLENQPDDIILNVLPLSFDYGLYQVLMAFKFGGTVILEKSFTFPHAVLQKVAEEGVTGFPIVPTISAILLQMDLSKYSLPSLRYLTNTGAALPTEHIERLRKAFPHARLYSMFGLTECKRVSYLPPDQLALRPTSVGKAMPNVEVYVVDEQGTRLPAGEVGELVVRGSNVMKGYWKLPQETDRALRPGLLPGERVLYTGDLFKLDSEGYLYWVGRRDDIIKSRGEKVSPKEIENVLYALEGISMAAVVGVPDPVLGQAVKAIVTCKEGFKLTVQDVQRHCASHLEDLMVPKIIEFRDEMPRTPTGKIDKRRLATEGATG